MDYKDIDYDKVLHYIIDEHLSADQVIEELLEFAPKEFLFNFIKKMNYDYEWLHPYFTDDWEDTMYDEIITELSQAVREWAEDYSLENFGNSDVVFGRHISDEIRNELTNAFNDIDYVLDLNLDLLISYNGCNDEVTINRIYELVTKVCRNNSVFNFLEFKVVKPNFHTQFKTLAEQAHEKRVAAVNDDELI